MNKKNIFKKDIRGFYHTIETLVMKNVSSSKSQKEIIFEVQELFHKCYPNISLKPLHFKQKIKCCEIYEKQKLYSSILKSFQAFQMSPAFCLETFGFYRRLTDIIDRHEKFH
ncbi:hypothetical protein M0R19_00995 [Candidatus Pacearchaeota archaeon]|jgi:hypothetical protein|nr:hypothetical protein [Candidatus Pacearchaeota archaeon]